MWSVYIHSDLVFKGTLEECQSYFEKYIKNTYDEVYFRMVSDWDIL